VTTASPTPTRESGAPLLVSAIIPVFNRSDMLGEAVASVLAQTHRPIEVLIVDDGSTDACPLVAAELAAAHPDIVRILRQDNAGPGAARNLGLRHARGEFIQYLDSDDLLEPRKFELQIAALCANPLAGVAYGVTSRIGMESRSSRIWARTGEAIDDIFPSFLMRRGWDTNSPLWRRSTCDMIGPWMELRCMEDWEHDLRAGLSGVVPTRVTEQVATVRDHSGDRASGLKRGFTTSLTRDLYLAHRSIWQQMRERGLVDWSYLRGFSRKMFWIARMCGERGLVAEAQEALAMAREMVATHRVPVELSLFAMVVGMMGWPRAVALSERARKVVRRREADIDV